VVAPAAHIEISSQILSSV